MGRNNADFDYAPTTYHYIPSSGMGILDKVIADHPTHGVIGYMEFYPPDENGNQRTYDMHVTREHRRKGIATGMFRHAEAVGLRPVHDTVRTDEGEKFAQSFGKDVPARTADSR